MSATISGRNAATTVPNTKIRMITAASSPISSAWFWGAVCCWTKSMTPPPYATVIPADRAAAVAPSSRSIVSSEISSGATE